MTKGVEHTIIKDGRIKFILGAIGEDGWNKTVDLWKKPAEARR